MAKKPTKNSPINDAPSIGEEAYVAWSDDINSKKEALRTASESLTEFIGVNHASGARRYSLDFSNLDSNTSGRPGLTRSDYDFFRPDETVPTRVKSIIRKADDIYQKVGLVKNVIDLMADFAVQGIRPVHRNKRIERFFKQWFKKINGRDRSERFLNNLYKVGNVVINRQTAKVNVKVTDTLYKSLGGPDQYLNDMDDLKVEKREIPWKYTFIDPVYVEVAAGPLASFTSEKRYELVLPASLRKIINAPKTEAEKSVISNLPPAIIEAAKTRKAYPLDPSKTIVNHYKKDDWQSWAFPMIYAIMDDIIVLEKLKLADMAALDGAISNIRIFKLGSLEHKIAPTKAATAKLAQILGNNVGGGTMDLVWGPDIELLESNTNVHNFLGEGKYTPHLNSVYAGLGIPPTLTGTYGAAGTTNNFISLKTLTQRLQYGRDLITEFWEKEMAIVQKAMGFKYPAKIEFDRMDLSNEEAEKSLLIQLADRNLVSDELLQKRFGFDPEMEKVRLNREQRERQSNRMIKKSGPWHDPQIENSLKKIALQSGAATPSQVGLSLDKKKNGEKTVLELRQSMMTKPPTGLAKDSPESLPGQPEQGRPRNSKDTQQRKEKTFKPRTGASLAIWAANAQEKIAEIINPIMLEFYDKKNVRSLSNEQTLELEQIKTKVLFDLKPFSQIDHESIKHSLHNLNNNNNKEYFTYQNYIKQISNDLNRQLTIDEQKQAKASFYSMVYE
jgi:hypothetical protein